MKSVVLLPATSTPSGRASSCIASKEPIRFVDPRGARLAERSRLLQRACSSDQASLSRPTVEAESPPASLPSKARSALLEIAGRDALEVENRDQHFEAGRTC